MTTDEIQCDSPLLEPWDVPGSTFSTRSLYCSMDSFTINRQGRLIYHKCRYEYEGDRQIRPGIAIPNCRRIPVEDIDMEYHGDIRMIGGRAGEIRDDLVARFTHGALEWIKPYSHLTDIHQSWFYSKD